MPPGAADWPYWLTYPMREILVQLHSPPISDEGVAIGFPVPDGLDGRLDVSGRYSWLGPMGVGAVVAAPVESPTGGASLGPIGIGAVFVLTFVPQMSVR